MGKNSDSDNVIERYIYDVVWRLPKEQREDIELELRGLILDMQEESGEDADIEQILSSLGSPVQLAGKYRDDSKSLIGAEYYEPYTLVLKIALIVTLIGQIVSVIVSTITNLKIDGESFSFNITRLSLNFGNIILALVSTFGVITLLFALLERQKVKLDFIKSKTWKVTDLPEVPVKKAIIKRGDSIASIICMIIFGVVFLAIPLFSSVYISDGGSTAVISVFNREAWNISMILLALIFAVGLIDEIIKLITGRYGRVVAISGCFSGAVIIISGTILLKKVSLWNPDFILYVNKTSNSLDVNFNFNILSNGLLIIMILVTVAEVLYTIYKSVRYGDLKF